MRITQALRLSDTPTLAIVGAGGKTTALFQLARELISPSPSAIQPSAFSPHPCVLVTATTHLHVNQIELADSHWIAQKLEDLARFVDNLRGVVLVTGPLDGERTKGIDKSILYWLREVALNHNLPLLIEADGSRQKPLKAPAEHEPVIPEFVETVAVVAGLSGLGKPLIDEWVHRVAQFERLSRSANARAITAEMVGRVLLHPEGGLKNIPATARRVALLNQADTPELQAQAKRLAEKLLPAYHAVIIASLNNPQSAICNLQSAIHAVYEPVAGIVLAAGEARRFGQPKQLLDYRGQTFVQTVAQTALAAGLSPVVVVSGANAEQVEAAVRDLSVRIVRNEDWQRGQSSSIRAGLADLTQPPPSLRETSPVPAPLSSPHFEVQKWGDRGGQGVGAVIFLLADQPQVPPTVLRALVERHSLDLSPIVAPQVKGQSANPVLFDRGTFPDLMSLTGGVGGRAIFGKHAVTYLPWHDAGLLKDIDTPADYQALVSGDG